MLRLPHRIMQGVGVYDNSPVTEHVVRTTQKFLQANAMQVILGDNVANYYDESIKAGKREWEMTSENYPNLVPPFGNFMVCFKFKEEDMKLVGVQELGWSFTCPPTSNSVCVEYLNNLKPILADHYDLAMDLNSRAKWSISSHLWYTNSKGQAIFPGDFMLSWVDERGNLLDYPLVITGHFAKTFTGNTSADENYWGVVVAGHVAFLTWSLLNCKNVSRVDVTEQEGPTKKWIRRQKAPTIKYQMLSIDPMRNSKPSHSGESSGEPKKAFHICRGHLKHYKEDGPGMFGLGKKYGTFWVPAHTRGDTKNGTIISTYDVKAPA